MNFGFSELTPPVMGPTDAWDKAVASAVTVVGSILERFLPDVSSCGYWFYLGGTDLSRPGSVVIQMQSEGLDEGIPLFQAAWKELGSTPDGRAVIAVFCAATDEYPYSVTLGDAETSEVADDPGLEDKLQEFYKGRECLPVLLATVRYYRAQAARGRIERRRCWWRDLD